MSHSREKITESQLQTLIRKTDIPGISLASFESKGTPSLIAVGTAEAKSETNVKVTPETVFQAASLSKPLFAYLVLKLMESTEYKDKINLDTPLHTILSEDRLSDEKAKTLTARMVLSHQTGLPGFELEQKSFVFKFDPGKGYAYSGIAYAYLQRVIEKLTGKNLEALAQEYVFGPLKMMHSSFSRPDPDKHFILAIPHDDEMKPQSLPPKSSAHAAHSLYTTAHDYALFVSAWVNDDKLRSAFTPVVSMTQDAWAKQEKVSEAALNQLAWGLGWGLQITNPGQVNEKHIAFHWGDVGDSKAFVAIDIKNRTGIVYFANSWNGLAIASDIVSAMDLQLDHCFEFLFKKYGFKDHKEKNWKAEQNRETVTKHVTHDRSGSTEGLSKRLLRYLENPSADTPSSVVMIAKSLNMKLTLPTVVMSQPQSVEMKDTEKLNPKKELDQQRAASDPSAGKSAISITIKAS